MKRSDNRTNDGAELKRIQNDIHAIDGKIDRLSNLLTETMATAAILREIESLEKECNDIQHQLEAEETASRQAQFFAG
jgi:DNA-binding FrmR family transcriptional regulator